MRIRLLELTVIDGIVYRRGDVADIYWPLARALIDYGVAEDVMGQRPTGERDIERLGLIGVYAERRRKMRSL